MGAMMVVIGLEVCKLSLQDNGIPEEDVRYPWRMVPISLLMKGCDRGVSVSSIGF